MSPQEFWRRAYERSPLPNAGGPSTSHGDRRRGNNIGVLRLVFAALVILSHSPEIIDGNRSREIVFRVFGTVYSGQIAVDGFFLVSGYLIVKSFADSRSVLSFLMKRCLRIYPGFLVAYVLSVLLVAPLAGGDLSRIAPLQCLAKFGLLLRPSVPSAFEALPIPELNLPMWTISYEFRCYLLVPLVAGLAVFADRARYAVLLGIVAFLYAIRHLLPNAPYGVIALCGETADMIRLALAFLVGGAFYIWREKIHYDTRLAIIAAVGLVGLLFGDTLAEPAIITLGGYLTFWYAFGAPVTILSRMADHADPSYGVYLYAWPIQSLIVLHSPGLGAWAVTAMTLPLAISIGLCSWYLVEKPALRLKDWRVKEPLDILPRGSEAAAESSGSPSR